MKKILAIVAIVGLTAAIAIGGTLAWLTATSDELVNTFTVGTIGMTIAEPKWDDTAGFKQKIIPGLVVDKDPTITITKDSEECYVYAYVKNGLVLSIGDPATATVVGDLDIDASAWELIAGDEFEGLYRYVGASLNVNNAIDASAVAQELEPVFTTVTINGEKVTMENISQLEAANIKVQGYAYQAAKVTQVDADTAAIAYFFPVTP